MLWIYSDFGRRSDKRLMAVTDYYDVSSIYDAGKINRPVGYAADFHTASRAMRGGDDITGIPLACAAVYAHLDAYKGHTFSVQMLAIQLAHDVIARRIVSISLGSPLVIASDRADDALLLGKRPEHLRYDFDLRGRRIFLKEDVRNAALSGIIDEVTAKQDVGIILCQYHSAKTIPSLLFMFRSPTVQIEHWIYLNVGPVREYMRDDFEIW